MQFLNIEEYLKLMPAKMTDDVLLLCVDDKNFQKTFLIFFKLTKVAVKLL